MDKEDVIKAQKDCPKCIHRDLCMHDRRVTGFPGWPYYMYGTFEERSKAYAEAVEQMKMPCIDFVDEEAAEKQKPQKPLKNTDRKYDKYYYETATLCARCHNLVYRNTHMYCSKCGQAQDWSEDGQK